MTSLLSDGSWDHEEVHVRTTRTGLPVVFAIHSRGGSGVALGGCRLLTSSNADDALKDAIRLSRGMTFKAAAAGLQHGGGKCVIAAPTPSLTGAVRRDTLLEVGDMVEEFDGRFATGADAGTDTDDARVLRERSRHIVGIPDLEKGWGDPSALTATGVIVAIRAACERVFDSDGLAGRRIAVLGLGKVGADVARTAAEEGAQLYVSDVDLQKKAIADEIGATWLGPEDLLGAETDVLSPCALGGVVNRYNVAGLRCRVIAGSANNQLADPTIAALLRRRGILYVPDFIANAGGMISVAGELDGYDEAEAMTRTLAIRETLQDVFGTSHALAVTTVEAAERLARTRVGARLGIGSEQ
ncbi:Glu/Leu/Phe/Val dehydrogenase dimerization domain-containing protein [Streptomyces sp. NPDC056405]|uniref:Glu/Leu/Phe/Val dehydrogenase family protein n=1 Tax=Streptomyces sp. NPDC056405 TaxID=3345811 RepID=UPI0035E045CE